MVNTVGTDIDENGNPVCVKMYDRDWIGQWYTHPCDHQANYVCEYPRTGFNNPDPPTTVDPSGPCLNEYWKLIAGRCYYSPADYQSFEAAQKECQAFGANLVSYGTLEEENNVDTQ